MTAEGAPETAEDPGAGPAPRSAWADPSRSLLVAIVVTVLAVPVLLIDLLPSTSEAATETQAAAPGGVTTSDGVSTTGAEPPSTATTEAPTTATTAPTTTWAAPTTTWAAPTTTTTWSAPSSTEATRSYAAPTTTSPPTTAAPTTTTTAAPPTTPTGSSSDMAFLACVKQRESGGYYGAVNPAGYYGAYQFHQSTWNNTASHAGRPDLVGVRPDHASPADQDAMALHLLQWVGRSPWAGYGC